MPSTPVGASTACNAPTPYFLDVSFVDKSHGWAVGIDACLAPNAAPDFYGQDQHGLLYTTSDGGAQWTLEQRVPGAEFFSVSFATTSVGWLTPGLGTSIFKTTDGGRSLISQTLPLSVFASAVATVPGDVNDAWAVGSSGIAHTSDGGAHWSAETLPAGIAGDIYSFATIEFADASDGWAAAGYYFTSDNSPAVLHTVDGGSTWTAVPIGTSVCPVTNAQSIGYYRLTVSGTTGLASGGVNPLARSTDGGATWNTEKFSPSDRTSSCGFGGGLMTLGDATHGWVVSANGTDPGAIIYATTDGGSTWTKQTPPAGLSFPFGAFALDASHAWVFGEGIAGTVDGGATWTSGWIQSPTGGGWLSKPGVGSDLATGGGQTFVIDAQGVLDRWLDDSWDSFPGGATSIAVDSSGNPWAVNSSNQIWHWNGAWTLEPGTANYVAAGQDGSVYVLGTGAVDGGWGVWRWNGGGWDPVDGGLTDVSVGTDGSLWGVNSAGTIFRRQLGGAWNQLPGSGSDVAALNYGNAWVIGAGAVPGGHAVWEWMANGWQATPGGAAADLAVDPRTGQLWAASDSDAISAWNGSSWESEPGQALDIASDDGTTFALGTGAADGGQAILRFHPGGWARFGGSGRVVAVDSGGNPWLVNSAHTISRWTGSQWQVLPGSANYVAAGADGSVYVLGTTAVSGGWDVWKWNGTGWDPIDGGFVDLSIGVDGSLWGVDSNHAVSHRQATGSWSQLSGSANDVAALDYNWAWVAGTSSAPGGDALWVWTGQIWQSIDGGAVDLALDPQTGLPWAVNASGSFYRRS